MTDINKLRQALGAVSPEEVEKLLDRLEAAEKDIALKERIIDSLGSELNAVANERDALRGDRATLQQMVYSLKDRLEATEKSDAESLAMYRKVRDERDAYKAAFEEWHQKTGWVQQGINDGSIPPTYLGWHRADVMADMLKSARRDYCALEGYYTELAEKLEAAEKAVTEAYQRGYSTGQEEIVAERDALRIELNEIRHGVAVTHDTIKALRAALRHEADCVEAAKAEIVTLRAEIEAMERQEPVAFALYSGWACKAVYLSEIEACEQRDRRQLTADLGGSLEAYRVAPLYTLPGAKGEEK